jgi:RNA polymerase sigma-70 factor (ECF subfamily)
MRDPNSEELLRRLQLGDERALSELSTLYGAKIYQLAFRYLRNHEDAEEVTQDVLYKVFRKVGEFRGDAALSSWIYRITFNAAMSRLRSASYQRAQDEQRDQAAADGEDAAATASLQEVADWSHMADEHLLRSQLRRRPSAPSWRSRPSTARRSCCAISRDVDGRSQRHAARERSDAEVALCTAAG